MAQAGLPVKIIALQMKPELSALGFNREAGRFFSTLFIDE